MTVPGCDSPACYEQAGVLFDAHDRECLPARARREAGAGDAPVAAPAVPVTTNQAKGKATQAKAKGGKGEAKTAKTTAPEKGENAESAAAPPEPPPAPFTPASLQPSKGKTIDLAAWGRGQADYLWAEVAKEIRKQYHVQVTERHDAVNLLIDQKVIRAAEARKDV